MPCERTDEPVAQLVRTITKRREILDALAEEPRDKRAVVESVDASRSTVDRALRELEERHLVERDANQFRLSRYGEHVFDAYRELGERVATYRRGRPVLNRLSESFDVVPAVLADATVVVAEKPNPYEPTQRIRAALDRATAMRGTCGFVHPDLLDRLRTRVAEDDVECEGVIDRSSVEYLRREYPDTYADFLDRPSVDVWVVEDEIEVSASVVRVDGEDHAMVATCDECGTVQALMINDAEAACDWVRAHFEAVRDRGEAVRGPSEDSERAVDDGSWERRASDGAAEREAFFESATQG